jgi:predicted phage tail protein
MKTVKLYGHLGKMFGKKHVLNVHDSYDAIRALSANYPNFRHEFAKQGRRYMVAVNKHLVQNNDELLLPANEIRFIPVVGGAGNGVGQILIGAALVVASFYIPGAFAADATVIGADGMVGADGVFAGAGISAGTASLMAGATFAFGASLALGGISKMLSQTPQTQQDSRNYGFSGPVNNTSQGNPVPILYGRMIIGSQVISASIRSADIPIADSAAVLNNSVNYKGQY